MILTEKRRAGARFLEWNQDEIGLVHLLEPQVFRRDPRVINGISLVFGDSEPKILKQVHSSRVVVSDVAGVPFSQEGDGLFTRGDHVLGMLTADCLPLLLVGKGGIALLHVGWRGMVGGIVEKGIEFFGSSYEVKALLGPCIRGCCYQVDDPFMLEVKETYPHLDGAWVRKEDEIYFDIPSAVERILADNGVKEVMDCGLCTFCGKDFPSYRKDGEKAGRMLTLAWVKR